MKYIDADKLIAEINNRLMSVNLEELGNFGCHRVWAYNDVKDLIATLQQEQPKGNLEYWLEHFGMPKENIDNCITQIAQGYGACRYLEGVQHGAEAVNELAKQDQPEADFEDKFAKFLERKDAELGANSWSEEDLRELAMYFYFDRDNKEQPEVELEKEIQSFWNANALVYRLGHVADINFLAYTARHFAEWGAIHLNARKEK